MALDKVLIIYDEQGNPVDYDILAKDVKFQPDGKDLPTKLAEMQTSIDNAGQVNEIIMNGQTYTPTNKVIDLGTVITQHQDISGKEDKVPGKGLSTNDFTTAEKDKLGALPTNAQLESELGNKANSSDVYPKSQTYNKNEVDGLVANAGKVKSVTINGTKKLPNETTGDVDLGTVEGTQGPQGPQGDTLLVDDNFDPVTMIVNSLDSSEATYALSARQGKILKQAIMTVASNLQAVYNALAGVAFTNLPKPTLTPIDWTGGTFYVSISKSLTGVDDTNDAVQVAENASYTNTLTPQTGLTMRSVVVTMGGVDITSTAYTAATGVISIAQVTGDIVITAVAEMVVTYNVRNHLLNMTSTNNASTYESGGSGYSATISADSGCTSNNDLRVLIDGELATLDTDYTYSGGVLSIADAKITGDIDIIATAATGTVTVKMSAPSTAITLGGQSFTSGSTADSDGLYTATESLTSFQSSISLWTNGTNKDKVVSIDFGGAKASLGDRPFRACTSLKTISNLVPIGYHQNNNISDAFYGCTELVEVDMSLWDMDAVTDFHNLFYSCSKLSQFVAPVRSDNGISVNITSLFSVCSAIKKIDLSNMRLTTASLGSIALNCSILESLDISGITSTPTDISFMCNGIKNNTNGSLTMVIGDLDLSNVSTDSNNKLTNVGILICTTSTPPDDALFTYMTQLTAIYVPNNAVEAYKTAWSSKVSIIHPISEYTE